ncbi:MAG: SdrD B-like domain-containing protein, partial [Candidatus Competibacteraceae bacterium]
TFTVTGTVPAGTTGSLTNTATVTPPAGVTDPAPGNNRADDTNPIGPQADLSVTKSSTPNPYVSGETLTYTIVASNAGPDAANNARIQDVLPGPLAAFTWTCTASGGSCGTASGSGAIDALVSLPNGASATFTVTGTVPAGTTGSLTNTATVTPPAGVTDPAPGNNRADDTNPVDNRTGTVTGVVYQDSNGNGVRDPGEPGIPGVQVAITDSTSAVAIATTDANGAYSQVVPAGATILNIDEATLPAGLTQTQGTNPTTVTVPTGGAASDVDGFSPATPPPPPPPPPPNNGAVTGVVYQDSNGNSVQDPGETGLSGVTIELLDTNGNVVATATTGANGSYSFPNVTPGAYTVRETDPTGFTSTTLNTLPISVAPGGAAIANFGDQPQGAVSGTVFNDLNGNGTQDPGETGLGGVTVTLTPTSGGPSVTTTTTSNGSYLFTAVAPGSYTVSEADPTDFISTTNNTVPVSVPSGGAATANFGDQQQGTISGVVFNDFNGNGVRDRGEPGISGVTIELLDSTGRVIATTTTTGDGRYLFTSLNPGTYTVRETDPTGFVSTTPNTGTATVPPGGIASPDFGDQQIRTVSGVVFNDLNGNGVQDPGELGIGGVTVVLRDDAQGTIQTTTTGSDGRYLFSNIAPGNYTVDETDPRGYTSTTSNRVAVTVPPNGAANANFGDQQSSSAIFDPPSGRKTVNTAGFPVIEWRMVWINGGNTAANRVRVIDPVPAGAIYDPNSLRCEARGQSTVATCVFEPANNRVVYEGNIAADPGALDEADAQNEVVIVFSTLLQSGVSTVENLASAHWDRNGNGSVDDDITGNQLPVETNNGQPVRPPVDIPLLAPWLFWMLAGLLALMGAIARQNSGWFRKMRRQN